MKENIHSTLSTLTDLFRQEWFRQGIITEISGGFICFLIACLFSRLWDCCRRVAAKIRDRRSLVVARPPGYRLVRFADLCCTQKTADLVNQMVADMRKEYFEALSAGRSRKARWLVAIHYVAIWRAFAITRPLAAAVDFVFGVARGAGK
jgi:hypothetical protein